MKIAVVGCGAVGSFYGAKLARAGHEVHFLLRSDYDAVRRQGVLIRSPEGDFQVRPQCARRPEEIGPAELVLIGLKTTANDQFAKLLPPLVGPATAVLTLAERAWATRNNWRACSRRSRSWADCASSA